MAEHTPTTEQVRSKYATVLDDTQGWRHSEQWARDFDRWLAEYVASERETKSVVHKCCADVEDLRNILAHPQGRDLLEQHRHLESDGCSCQATYDYGPADMTRDQWIAHVVDDARTRGMI